MLQRDWAWVSMTSDDASDYSNGFGGDVRTFLRMGLKPLDRIDRIVYLSAALVNHGDVRTVASTASDVLLRHCARKAFKRLFLDNCIQYPWGKSPPTNFRS